jgi:hypothetical protein
VTLTATNGSGSGEATLTLAVAAPLPGRPDITSPAIAAGTVGVPLAYQITATNQPTHFFATSPSDKGTVAPASSLPAGLTYDVATGLRSGTPKAAGVYPIQVAAMNGGGVVTKLVTLTIKEK